MRVKFKNLSLRDNVFYLRKWYTEEQEIPSDLIEHGSTGMNREQAKKGGLIVDTYGIYYIVSYIDIDDVEVCLGFLKDDLIFPTDTNSNIVLKGE